MMFRFTNYICRYCYCFSFPIYWRNDPYDQLESPKPFIPQTGFERIRALAVPDEHGYVSKEYITAVNLTASSFIVGSLYGAAITGKPALETFLQTNEQTRFLSPYEAKRKMNDYVALKSFQKGTWYGCKVASVTCIFSFSTICIIAYRGKEGVLEYIVSGALAGACARLYLGWKATLAAGCVGGLLGTIIGVVSFVGGKVSGTTPADFRQWMYDMRVERDNIILEAQKEDPVRYEEYGILLRAHMARLKSRLGYKISEKDKAFVVAHFGTPQEEDEEYPISSPKENPELLSDTTDSTVGNISHGNVTSSGNLEIDGVGNTKILSPS